MRDCVGGSILLVCVVLALNGSVFASTVPGAAISVHESPHAHGHNHSHLHAGDLVTSSDLLRLLCVYALVVTAASLLGGWIPTRLRLTHVQFQRVLSIVGGMLLGIGMFHLFPHAVHELGVVHIDFIVMWMVGGILMMFLLLRAFHVHHHEPDPSLVNGDEPTNTKSSEGAGQDHSHQHAHCNLSWAGMLFGLGIHTLLDGVALGASMQADAMHGPHSWWGLGVLLGIAVHIPLDSLSFTSLMLGAKRTKAECVAANLIYSLLCPVGAALFLWGVGFAGDQATTVIGAGLAFSAGLFLCIALADLLPEMEFHTHHRWQLSTFLLTGVALAWGMRFLEPAHLHP